METLASTLGEIIIAQKKVEVVDWMKKKDLHIELVSTVTYTLGYQQEELFDKFQAEICNPSNKDNEKIWILFQVPIIMKRFDTIALENIINHLDTVLPSSQPRFTGYLESIANGTVMQRREQF